MFRCWKKKKSQSAISSKNGGGGVKAPLNGGDVNNEAVQKVGKYETQLMSGEIKFNLFSEYCV